MPAAERHARRPSLATALALLVALVAAMLPLLRVIAVDVWVVGALAIAVLVLAAGDIVRRLGLPAGIATAIEVAVWYLFTMLAFLAGTAIAGVIPTAATIDAVVGFVQTAVQEVALGAAPLPASTALSFCIVTAFGALTVVLDHVVITTRMPLLASVALVAVWLIPSLVVPAGFDIVTFVALAIGILLLLRTETRSRDRMQRTGPAGLMALTIGAVATIVALVVTPLLPTPPPRTDLAGSGMALGINADLDLGRDLRQPATTQVLTLRTTDAPQPPYLRVTTLSTLDGNVWRPDAGATSPLTSDRAFTPIAVDPQVPVVDSTAIISVSGLASAWLPVPYAAVNVSGLSGPWTTASDNRTLIGDGTTAADQTYTVESERAKPTLEQIRARPAAGSGDDARYTALPAGMPSEIAALARARTAGTTNDYDALLALQRWFRGADFTYSLEAPVAQGFDGSGVDAVARFLEVRKGYCVHFASAFALMARSLGMPTRIVIGYLPGTSTGQMEDGQRIYTVASSQLHAWPEVYFQGIGWVGFDPTKGLGQPTSFTSASATTSGSLGGAASGQESAAPEDTATPAASPSATPGQSDAAGPRASGGGPLGLVLPLGGAGILVLAALGIPSIAGAVRRRTLAAEARAGRAGAAWTLVQDTAIDLGIPVPPSESPRAFGGRLAAVPGVDPLAVGALVAAIERDAYAAAHDAPPGDTPTGSLDAALSVRAALLAAATPARRLLAVAFPRSLAIRPGSAFATASGGRSRTG
ncbi:DUF3488 and transglutaminase-like domain-containing protein [Microbacterium sp. X-17]|uniref:transglutaminase family protein n=1 Tax=Microbacterium sp. X-17 TaxID=3144404 RepID=UPI0031F5D5D9